jgi:hypothetical protein
MIDNRDEYEAKRAGYRPSIEDALKVHGIVKSKYHQGKWIQNKVGKWVEVHPYGKQGGVEEGSHEDDVARQVAHNERMSSKTPPLTQGLRTVAEWAKHRTYDDPEIAGSWYRIAKFGMTNNRFNNSIEKTMDFISNIHDMDPEELYDVYGLDEHDQNALYHAYENVYDQWDELQGDMTEDTKERTFPEPREYTGPRDKNGKPLAITHSQKVGKDGKIYHWQDPRADEEPKKFKESATAGATSAANIGTVVSPQLSPGKARGKKSYTGSMSSGSGTKAPPQPKVVQPKNPDGTAKNGADMKGNIFGGPAIKR